MSRMISITASARSGGRRGPSVPVPGAGDVTAPTFVSAAVANAAPTKIVLTYSEALSATLTGSITVGGATRTVSTQTVVGSTVEVVVNAAYASTDTITVTVPSGCVKDAAGNSAAPLSAQAVTNNVAPAGGFSTDFDAFYSEGFTLDNSTTLYARPTQAKPTVKSTGLSDFKYTDQVFGTKVYLATNVNDFTDPDGPQGHVRNDYSKRQMWNADESRFIALASNSHWHLYNADTFEHINVPGHTSGRMPGIRGSDCDPIWHPTDANKLWYTADFGGLTYYELDITTGESSPLFTFAGRVPSNISTAAAFLMSGEGRPSNDGRYWCFLATTAGGSMVGLMTYDRVADTITSSVATTNKPNWTGMSQSGQFAIVGWNNYSSGLTISAAAARPLSTADGTRAYHGGVLTGSFTQLDNSNQHGDLGYDKAGNEVYISSSYSPFMDVGDGPTYMKRLSDGTTHVFTSPNLNAYAGSTNGMHFSCTNFNRPGWAVITYESGTGNTYWRDGSILIVELTSTSPRVYRVAHHQSIADAGSGGGGYFSSPLAAPNRDLTRIMFGSDFRSSSGPFNQFMVGLPSDCFPA
jgi:hypothetical protein